MNGDLVWEIDGQGLPLRSQLGSSILTSLQSRVMNDEASHLKAPFRQGTPKKSRGEGGRISGIQSTRLRVVDHREQL